MLQHPACVFFRFRFLLRYYRVKVGLWHVCNTKEHTHITFTVFFLVEGGWTKHNECLITIINNTCISALRPPMST